jgi:ATP-dependent exoDNAse (exonuclease V) alpha subunit
MFLKNDRGLGVKNGTLGTVAEVSKDAMHVVLDGSERREVSFAFKDYAALDYGYAATVHKTHGVTVDHAFMLATPGMDHHWPTTARLAIAKASRSTPAAMTSKASRN